MLFSFVYGPAEHLFGFLMNVLSRLFEYQADAFATRLGHSLQGKHSYMSPSSLYFLQLISFLLLLWSLAEPLIKIHVENASSLLVDPWYSTYHYSHPTLLERIEAINQIKKQ